MDWTDGYLAEVDYTHGYYRELSPGLIDYALRLSGHAPPARANMRYLELGYGQGISANIHAAAVDGECWGVDFNPIHAANAQSLALAAGSDACFFDDSFADFLDRDDAPSFDYIVLHGIWSWINDDNRRTIVEIIRKRLKVGGAVYISYNTLPGWAVAMPLRHMLSLHAETVGSYAQGVLSRIDDSISFGVRLHDAGARYFAVNPVAKARLDQIAGQNRNYVAHEYFNHYWAPTYFSEVNASLADAKLNYACPAGSLEQMDALQLTAPQLALLKELSHTVLRETVRDYLLNQQFRRDIYVRGARILPAQERLERLRDERVVLTAPPEDITFDATTTLGKINLKPEIYKPIIDELAADDGGPKRIGDLAASPKLKAIGELALLEGLAVLVGTGRANPAQSDATQDIVSPRCHRLNAALIDRARTAGDVNYLASPVLGGGIPVGRFEQMFLGSVARGRRKPEEWASDAWNDLAKQNQSIIKDGVTLDGADKNLEELRAQAKVFSEKRLGLLQRLGAVG